MKVLINAVSAKLGGAATYIRNLARSLPELAASEDSFVLVVPPEQGTGMESSAQVRVESGPAASGAYGRRWWWDQVTLRRILARERPDVLFSSANFAMHLCPCPQALLVRNPLYFSPVYDRGVLPGKGLALRAETAARRWLAWRSMRAADCVVTPSQALLDDIRRTTPLKGTRAVVNPYGVPRARLHTPPAPRAPGAKLRLLWVSHYADHKDLATLLRAAARLRGEELPFELTLTLDPGQRGQHTVMPPAERALLGQLGDAARLAGVLDYEATWRLYAEADIFVFPSLLESFGHPLVEALASGVPVVASDIAIHREVCDSAAEYFAPGDDAALATLLRRLLADSHARARLAARARPRAQLFVWEDHVARLLATLRETAVSRRRVVDQPAAPVAQNVQRSTFHP